MYVDNNTAGIDVKRRWVILIVAYLCSLAFAITMQSVPPILSIVMAEFKLSYAQGGLLMSVFALPGIVVSIPAGMLADRYGQRTIGIISFCLVIIGTVTFALGNSLTTLAIGRVISGIGAISLMVLSPQLLAQWFAGRELGIAMGVFNTAVPLGTIMSLNFLSMLAENLGWRVSVWLSAAVPLIALVIFVFLFTSVPNTSQKIRPKDKSFFQSIRLTGTSIWIVGITWMLFNAAIISLFTFTPEFLQSSGLSIASAGVVTSAVMWPAIFLSPVVGYIIDKIDRKRSIIAIGGLALAIFIVIVPAATSWILVLMLLIGVVQNMVPAPIFALPTEITTPERLGLGFGIISSCQNLGILVGPVVVGVIMDITGSYQASYALMAGFAFLMILTMFSLRRR